MSRLKNSAYNTAWALLSNLSIALFGIVSRSIFLNILGDELMGVNSLFADVITLFSFVDMGFGTAITFSLYKPIANNDLNQIQAILKFLEKIFRSLAVLVALICFCFSFFLDTLNTQIPLQDLRIYYFIFAFNNVIGYLWSYRDTYVNAKQEARIVTVFNTIFSFATTLLQIAIVLLVENFLLYLLANSAMIIVRKIVVNVYILKRYPETNLKKAPRIAKEDAGTIWNKSKSLAVHKIANLTISQTDSLVVSYMISVKEWGYVSNYLMLKNTIGNILAQIYSAVLPSMGDLVARENKSVQLHTFYVYDFLNFWMYGFCFVALATLSSPFVGLVFGLQRVIAETTVFLFFFSFFIAGLRDPVSILREANGAIENDKIYTVLSAVVNLVSSVAFVKILGLPGVFLGTLCSTMVVLIARPIVLFNQVYNMSSAHYFRIEIGYTIAAIVAYMITNMAVKQIAQIFGITVFGFVVMVAAVTVIPNLIWCVVFFRNPNFRELIGIAVNFVRGKRS